MSMIIFSLSMLLFSFSYFSVLDMISLMCVSEIFMFLYMYLVTWYHIMILLMILELFMLKNFFLSTFMVGLSSHSSYFVFLFITLSVAEASVGVSLLTMLIRSHGNDSIFI